MRLAPALTSAAIIFSHTDRIGDALLVLASVLIVARILDPGRRLAQLLPLAGFVTRALIPVVGLLLAWALAIAFNPIGIEHLAPAALGGVLVMAAAAWLVSKFEARVEIRIAVAGPPQVARTLSHELELAAIPGYRVVGWIDAGIPDELPEVRRLGSFAQIASIVESEGIDLIVNTGNDQQAVAKVVAEELLEYDVRLSTVSQLQEEVLGQISLETIDSSFAQYLMHPRFRGGSAVVKRVSDVTIAGIGLAITAPALALAALANRRQPEPLIVRERRVGKGGAEFEMLKLRTGRGPIGSFLRRTYIDEVPQLVNVVRGDMSLVGPRPELPERKAELERRIPLYDRRFLISPGVTGWAQVRRVDAADDPDSAWKLSHDLYYLKHRRTVLDAMIMLETLVVAAHGFRLRRRASDEALAAAN